MPSLLSTCEPLLRVLGSTSFVYLKNPIIQKARKELFHCITEICYNLIKGNIPLNTNLEAWLKKNNLFIKILADKKITIARKRKYLLRTKPDFLPKLFSLVDNHAEKNPADSA
jgi:hypothetical protein